MNALFECNKDLYNQITGTEADCFYIDAKIEKFWDIVTNSTVWIKQKHFIESATSQRSKVFGTTSRELSLDSFMIDSPFATTKTCAWILIQMLWVGSVLWNTWMNCGSGFPSKMLFGCKLMGGMFVSTLQQTIDSMSGFSTCSSNKAPALKVMRM